MYNESLEQMFKLNKNLSAPLGEFQKTSTEMFRRIAEQNLALINENFTRWSDQMKRLTNLKKPEDFLNLQKDFISEDISATIENVQKLVHLSLENMEECANLYTHLREPVLRAAEKATKHAERYAEKETR